MTRTRPAWTFAIVSIALFMVVLDNLVVTNALPSIRADLGATIQSLEWTVNAYTLPFAARRLNESHGPARSLDLPGVVLASAGMLGLVYGIVRGSELGWTSTTVLSSLIAGALLIAAFLAWEARAAEPMLPLRFFRSRAFSSVSVVSLAMYFGVFGSIFLLAQFFQVTQGYSPLEAGLRTLPWTAMPMLVAPIAGVLSDRIGSRPLMATGRPSRSAGWRRSQRPPSRTATSCVLLGRRVPVAVAVRDRQELLRARG